MCVRVAVAGGTHINSFISTRWGTRFAHRLSFGFVVARHPFCLTRTGQDFVATSGSVAVVIANHRPSQCVESLPRCGVTVHSFIV